jgi:predicted aconitase
MRSSLFHSPGCDAAVAAAAGARTTRRACHDHIPAPSACESPPAGRRRLLSAAIGAILTVPLFTGTATAAGPRAPVETASVVSNWNATAVTTLVGDTSKSLTEDFVYLGFVHAAIYNAMIGVHGRYEPYRFRGRAPHGTGEPSPSRAATSARGS